MEIKVLTTDIKVGDRMWFSNSWWTIAKIEANKIYGFGGFCIGGTAVNPVWLCTVNDGDLPPTTVTVQIETPVISHGRCTVHATLGEYTVTWDEDSGEVPNDEIPNAIYTLLWDALLPHVQSMQENPTIPPGVR